LSQRRLARVAQAIKQVVSQAILMEMRDPRAKNITVIAVEVPEDLRTAKVYVSVMGDPKTERLSLQGLNAARGFLQQRIAEELDLRWTPILAFVIDPGVKKSVEISRTLRAELPLEDEVEEQIEDEVTATADADRRESEDAGEENEENDPAGTVADEDQHSG
jgi:ribosome-binding factor A